MKKLAGKVAVITGGASGIGAESVRHFVEQGAEVVIADILDDEGRALADSLGGSAEYVRTDVTQEEDVRRAVELACTRFGRLDCMFNNAGISGAYGPISEIPVHGFDQTMAVLLRGVFLGIKHAAPLLSAQGSGSIISTASVAGLGVGYGPHIYSAAKAAVIHLTRSVAAELGERGVRVNCLCPGGIATPIFGRGAGLSQAGAERTVEFMGNVLSSAQALPRAGMPVDVARAAAWLASDESSFVTGHALVVDGGLLGGQKWSARQAEAKQFQEILTQIGDGVP